MNFWTDGSSKYIDKSKTKSVIAWSAVYTGGVIIKKSKVGGNSLEAELLAIRDLLENLKKHRSSLLNKIKAAEDNITIITDSQPSIRLIENEVKQAKSEKGYNIIVEKIKQLMQGINDKFGIEVIFQHTKGHSHDLGNVFADYVAGQESDKCKYDINVAIVQERELSSRQTKKMRTMMVELNKEVNDFKKRMNKIINV